MRNHVVDEAEISGEAVSPDWLPASPVAPAGQTVGAEPAPRALLAQATLLLLTPAGTDTRTLVLGQGAAAIAAAAVHLGGIGLAVAGGATSLHEFADASCDSVILNRLLEPHGVRVEAPGEDALEEILKESRRVLKPGGRILLTLENPFSIANLAGALRSGRRVLLEEARRHRRTLEALLRQCGTPHVYLLWPRAQAWSLLQPEAAGIPAFEDRTLRGRAQTLILSVARRVGWESRLAPGYLIAARPRGDAPARPTLVERLQEVEGVSGRRTAIAARANSRSATFVAGDLFFKVPLHPFGTQAMEAEVRHLEGLSRRPIARYAPLPARMRQDRGVRYATFCALPGGDRPPSEADMLELLRVLHGTPQWLPLSQTRLWSRFFSDSMAQSLCTLGGEPLLRSLRRRAARRVLAADIHGDSHCGNVLARGELKYLVDWDRFEERSPVLLDYAAAYLSCNGYFSPGNTRPKPDALRCAIGRSDSALSAALTEACGELSPEDATILFVLHRGGWMLRRHGLSNSADLDAMRQDFAYCCRYLLETATPGAPPSP